MLYDVFKSCYYYKRYTVVFFWMANAHFLELKLNVSSNIREHLGSNYSDSWTVFSA